MNYVTKWLSGIGMLIFTYLLLSNGNYTTKIISTIATNSVAGIKALQGR